MDRDFLVFDHADGTFTAAGPDEAFAMTAPGLVPPYLRKPVPPFRPDAKDKFSLTWPDDAHDHGDDEQYNIRDKIVEEEEE
jgi:hypothetical protein